MAAYGLTGVGTIPAAFYFGMEAFYPGGLIGAMNDNAKMQREVDANMNTAATEHIFIYYLGGHKNYRVMERIKRAYYYFYYRIYKTFSKNKNPMLSVGIRADIVVIAVKVWIAISFLDYLSILLGYRIELSITEPLGLIPLVLALGSTLYFLTFSNKWKPYFREFEKFPKRKNLIGGIIVWSVVIFAFINLIVSVELAKVSWIVNELDGAVVNGSRSTWLWDNQLSSLDQRMRML